METILELLILLPVFLVLFVTTAGIAVFVQSWRRMKAENKAYLNVGGWVALMVPVVLDVIVLATMDVGAAKEVLLDGWGGIVGVVGSILLPIFGFKTFDKFASKDTTIDRGPGA